jgi:hypothetical protein
VTFNTRQSVGRRSAIETAIRMAFIASCGAALTGCASSAPKGGDPGAKALPPGQTCQNLLKEQNVMISRGVQSSVEAQQAGRKLSPQQKADADRYNSLLEQYLGARCQV